MPRSLFGPEGYKKAKDEEPRGPSPSWDDQEDEIAQLVAQANDGNERALEDLLLRFKNYLDRWESMLLRHAYDINQRDMRFFICLYIRDPQIRQNLKAGKSSKRVTQEVWRVVNELNALVTGLMEPEDLRQLLVMVFLHCLRKYRPMVKDDQVIPFFRYFYYRFRLELKTELTKLTMDPVFSYGYNTLDVGENGGGSGDMDPRDGQWDEIVEGYNLLHDDLSDDWVSGEGACHPFSALSAGERQVIKWHYRDGMKRSQIAEILGCSRVMVSNMLKRAVERMAEALDERPDDWEFLDWGQD